MVAAWEDAIKRGDVQIVHDLLGRGIDADARDRYGQRPSCWPHMPVIATSRN
jgi:hypothetical protein